MVTSHSFLFPRPREGAKKPVYAPKRFVPDRRATRNVARRDLLRSDTTSLGRTAAVVRHGCDVANQRDLETDSLESAERTLPPRPGPLYEDGDRTHPVLHGLAGGFFGRQLRCEWSALSRALEPPRSGAGPRDGVAVHVRDRHHGVVERRLNVRDPRRHVLLYSLLLSLRLGARAGGAGRCAGLGLRHDVLTPGRLARRTLAGTRQDSLAGTLPCTSVGVRSLPVDRQPSAVTEPPVAAKVHQALDVHLHLSAQIAFDLVVRLEHLADLPDLRLGQLLGHPVRRDPGLLTDASRGGLTNPVEVR